MKIFISGGCKNGKSSLAQQLAVKLSQGKKRYYLATMIPCDGEDLARIRRHRADRDGLEFETVEAGRNICAAIKDCDPAGSYLLDSVTALDAAAELVGKVRKLFNDHGVVYQTSELGKVDQGGGGTIAYIMANYDMDVIDAGVAMLSMHAPWEIVSKADVYMTSRAYHEFFVNYR